jgi:hypothetical protein
MPRRATVAGRDTCTGRCETRAGCDCTPDTVPTDYSAPGWLDACAPEGGKHAGPVASTKKQRPLLGLLLVLLGWPAVAALVALAALLARYWPMAWPLG